MKSKHSLNQKYKLNGYQKKKKNLKGVVKEFREKKKDIKIAINCKHIFGYNCDYLLKKNFH